MCSLAVALCRAGVEGTKVHFVYWKVSFLERHGRIVTNALEFDVSCCLRFSSPVWSQETGFGLGFRNLASAIAPRPGMVQVFGLSRNYVFMMKVWSLASCLEIEQADMKLLSNTAAGIVILCQK